MSLIDALYRVIHEDKLIFGNCDKNIHMDMCIILNVYRNEPFEPPDLTP